MSANGLATKKSKSRNGTMPRTAALLAATAPLAPAPAAAPVATELLRVDLGCGPNKRVGFIGADAIAFPGVDVVLDLRKPWPWPDNSVIEAHCSHCLEHFTAMERCHIVNELYRVLVPGGTCMLIVPHWSSSRAYGDPTHQWPPVAEFWFYYLDRNWRAGNAPHTDIKHLPGGFDCDFEATWGYGMRPDLVLRAQEYQQFAMQNYKEACQDIICTMTKRAAPAPVAAAAAPPAAT